jgi:hypothetical protein
MCDVTEHSDPNTRRPTLAVALQGMMQVAIIVVVTRFRIGV